MLSILIPVFNFDIRVLVTELHEQCLRTGSPFEILCFDDGSTGQWKAINREVQSKNAVRYREMPQNLGRSGIRNALGHAASFPYLLFMDCDSKVVDDCYIEKYLEHLQPDRLVYGGRVYSKERPLNQSLLFHWKYGSEREVNPSSERKKHPWHSFMTNNFLIPKQVFLDILFDDSLKQYGHEDTLFGLELAARKIPIQHIDAPLEHIGLETAERFLAKTIQGLENLHALWSQGKNIDTRLLRIFVWAKNWHLSPVLSAFFNYGKNWMEEGLSGAEPSMLVFDWYKLTCLCSIHESVKRNS